MPRTNGRPRHASAWLGAYRAGMGPWFKRADAAIALSRRLLGSADDGRCTCCAQVGAHADGCVLMHWAGKS